jgi:hypothetical protein
VYRNLRGTGVFHRESVSARAFSTMETGPSPVLRRTGLSAVRARRTKKISFVRSGLTMTPPEAAPAGESPRIDL